MVSVIIPTYKRAKYIERAIDSVLNQTYKEYEIIVVDDNNPNTTDRKQLEKIMNKYKENKKIIYIQHEKNRNGAAARNTGIRIARGEYITFLDDDDYFLPDRIRKLVDILERNKEYNVAYSSVVIVENKKIVRIKRAQKQENLKIELLKQKSFFGTGSNMFFKAEELKKINGFDESFKRNQDLEVMIRFLRKNKIIALDEPLVVKDQEDRTNEPTTQDLLEIREYFLRRFKNDIQEIPEKINEIYAANYYSILSYALTKKDFKMAKKINEKLLQYTNMNIKMKLKLIIYFLDFYMPFMIKGKNYLQNVAEIKKLDKSVKEYVKNIENN